VASERRKQIVDGFLALISERGLDSVTLDDVAKVAGLQRAALRHFVGNRRELLAAAVEELTRRFELSAREQAGQYPTLQQLLAALFSAEWASGLSAEHAAFDVLLQEATRDPQMRLAVRRAYDTLIAEIAAALKRSHPHAKPGELRNCAYALTCLVEHNVTLQQLGFAAAHSKAMLQASKTLVSTMLAQG
jgi:AcrR family transcriptional regulator